MSRRSKSNKNKKRDNTSPEQDELHVGSKPDENSMTLVKENENLKKVNESNLKEIESLRAENKSLKEELQKIQENLNQSQNVDCRPSENVTKIKSKATSEDAHNEASNEVSNEVDESTWEEQGACADVPKSNWCDDQTPMESFKDDSSMQEKQPYSVEQSKNYRGERSSNNYTRYNNNKPRDTDQRHSNTRWDMVDRGKKTKAFETFETSGMTNSSNFNNEYYPQSINSTKVCNTTSEDAHNEASNEVDESTWREQGACADVSKSNWNDKDQTTPMKSSKGDSRRQEKQSYSEEQNKNYRGGRSWINYARYNNNEPRGTRQRHYNERCNEVYSGNKTNTFETDSTSYVSNYSKSRNDHYPQRDKHERYSDRNDTRKSYYGSGFMGKRQQSVLVQLIEVDGDLFTAPNDHSLAHCVAQDLRMGSGIAVQFRKDFKRVDELIDQRKKVGEVAILEHNNRFIYYLITKKFSNGKPTMEDLQSSLLEMRDHMEKNAVMNLSIPRIGCGLDRLHWRDVRSLLLDVFADLKVIITVYNFIIDSSTEILPKKSSLRVFDKEMDLINIERNTLLLFFGSECGHVDSTMKKLDEKFRFIDDYKQCSRKVGEVVKLVKCGEILCILIVKKHQTDFISYPDLLKCLQKVKKIFKDEKYFYMGFSAFIDGDDDLTVAKIVTLFKTLFANFPAELWICWPPELQNVYNEYFLQNR